MTSGPATTPSSSSEHPARPAEPAAARSLTGIRPSVPPERLLADLVPPRHFAETRFATYRASDAYPSQAATLARLEQVAGEIVAPPATGLRALVQRKRTAPAIYMDGGFGVGKTHLLTSLAHAVREAVGPDAAAYGTFVEYTNLVGALGFLPTVEALATKRLVCIDEFELDDPGDTVLMSRLLRELADRGVALAATSNTLPEALGEGRFAAEDFLREIQALAARFEVLRVDGEDYRHRAVVTESKPLAADVVAAAAAQRAGATLDAFDDLLGHLATVHPSRYGALLDGVELVALTDVHPVSRQDVALRLVVLVDRLYDRDVPVLLGGSGETGVFTEEMLRGGYRKKYYRALSRLGALAEEGRALARPAG